MDTIARSPALDRQELFRRVEKAQGLCHAAIVEKDFWVCWALRRLFEVLQFRPSLIFKGGTSLSKVYRAIDRFSEDVDLSLSRRDLGFADGRDPEQEGISKKEARRRLEDLVAECQRVVGEKLVPALRDDFSRVLGRGGWAVGLDPGDSQTVVFEYPATEISGAVAYVRPAIRLEMGARSDDWPAEDAEITPYAAEVFPDLFAVRSCRVRTLLAERTFWEKATLLHAECHRPADKPPRERMSRHYYDLYRLARLPIADRAMEQGALLDRVVAHKTLFFASAWANYETARPGGFRLVPPAGRLDDLRRDYAAMGTMIFGAAPAWDDIVAELTHLEARINGMGSKREGVVMAGPRKKKTALIAAKPYTAGNSEASLTREPAGDTVAKQLVLRLRAAGAYTTGDQTPPAAILWPDGEGRWRGAVAELKSLLPELYSLGPIAPEDRTGPAIWLRCVEARMVDPVPPAGLTPIFYLPRIGRQDLRAVEDCSTELEPLVEMQFRGAVWSHPNGRDWTPFAFLSSAHGGLGLDVPGDPDTAVALDRALPAVLKEPVADLTGEKLDAQFLNMLLAPDLPVEILRWMNDPAGARKRKTDTEWQAFCAQCRSDGRLDPEKDGELRAASLLGNRERNWAKVWARFAEAPARYPGVVALLDKAAPSTEGMLAFDREFWPVFNDRDEALLAKALLALKDKPAPDAARAVLDLDKAHGCRRQWVWREVGRAPLAVALESLALLATLTTKALAAADAAALAGAYVQFGWEADAAALAALAAGNTPEADEAIAAAVRALYLPWLDESARNLQHLAAVSPTDVRPRLGAVEAAAVRGWRRGRWIAGGTTRDRRWRSCWNRRSRTSAAGSRNCLQRVGRRSSWSPTTVGCSFPAGSQRSPYPTLRWSIAGGAALRSRPAVPNYE